MIPKFKAWHKAEKVMCDVSIINFNQGAFLVGVKKGKDEVGDKYFVAAPTDGRFCNFDEFELLQYTGLKDKNGKEIYEGDVVSWEDAIDDDIDNCYVKTIKETVEYKGGAFYPVCMMPGEEFEIIGNIHANPELLK